MSRKISIQKEELEDLYINKKLSYKSIAMLIGSSSNWIKKKIHEYGIIPRKNCGTGKDLSGKRFGKLIAIEVVRSERNRKVWKCKCDCGQYIDVASTTLKTGKKTCGCSPNSNVQLDNPNWRGYKDMPATVWTGIVRGAEARNIEVKISIEYAWQIWEKQDGRCSYTGVKLQFPSRNKETRNSQYNASLDRIDSSKGYIEGNVQWVRSEINIMKSVYSDDFFLKICRETVRYRSEGVIKF